MGAADDDDEEILSDDAFDSEDEQKYGGMFGEAATHGAAS